MKPVVDRLKQRFEGTVEFRLFNLERDPAASEVADQYGVQWVPTFVLVNTDGSVADTLIGEVAEDELAAALDALE